MCELDESVYKINNEPGRINTRPAIPYTYDEAAEITGNGRYTHLVLSTCCIISLAVALDLFGFGLVVATAACDLKLSMEQKGLLSSIPFAGLLFAFPWGYFADTRGRRRALIWSTSVGFVFAALSSLSTTWYIMAVFKFVGCSFSSAASSITMTYLAECSDTKHRSQYLQVMNSVNLASEAVSFFLALLILSLPFDLPLSPLPFSFRPWRLLTLLMSLPLGIGAVLMVYLHESPKFLAGRGEEGRALEVMVDVFERNGGRGDFPVKTILVSKDKDDHKSSFFHSIVSQTVPIFKPPLLSRTLQLFYLIMIICSTNNVFVMWFPTIVNSFFTSNLGVANGSFCARISDYDVNNVTSLSSKVLSDQICNDSISTSTIYCGIAYGVFFALLNLLISRLSAHRRLILIITFTVSAVSCALVNLAGQPEASLVFFVLLQSTSICIGIAGSYFNDWFPTSCRALATSLGLMTGRVASFVGTNLVGAVINDYCQLTFYCWAVFVLSGIAVSLLLPSDKNNAIPTVK